MNDELLAVDNMEQTAPHGTTPWTRFVIEQPVDPRATIIEFGVRVDGAGTAWFDSLEIEIDGKPYPQPAPPAPPEPSAGQIHWVKRNAIPLSTDQPGRGFKDLQPLKKVIGDARIIGLGEQTHGTSEFQTIKHRQLEFLASEMGFTLFVQENGMPETVPVNEYVLNGVGDPKQAVQDMHTWDWYTQEMVDMVAWMRQFNQSGKGHVEFWGVDMQGPNKAMANVRKFLSAADPEFAPKVYQALEAALAQQRPALDVREAAVREAGEVLAVMRSKREVYSAGRTKADVDWAIQNARIVQQAITYRQKLQIYDKKIDLVDGQFDSASCGVSRQSHGGECRLALGTFSRGEDRPVGPQQSY